MTLAHTFTLLSMTLVFAHSTTSQLSFLTHSKASITPSWLPKTRTYQYLRHWPSLQQPDSKHLVLPHSLEQRVLVGEYGTCHRSPVTWRHSDNGSSAVSLLWQRDPSNAAPATSSLLQFSSLGTPPWCADTCSADEGSPNADSCPRRKVTIN